MAKRTFWVALLITVAGFALSLLNWSSGLALVVTLAFFTTVGAGIVWAASSLRQRHGTVSPTSTSRTPERAARKTGKPWNPPQAGQYGPQ